MRLIFVVLHCSNRVELINKVAPDMEVY
jgi:hypothetical protein